MAILRRDDTVQDATGRALAGALVYVLTQPANVPALTPLANVFSNTSGTAAANPQTTDGFGHSVEYLDNSQLYTVVYVHPLIGQVVYPDQDLGNGGGGSTPFSLVPAGAINGSNTIFTLPITPALLFLMLNGNVLTPGLGYTISGNTITMASPPQAGEEPDELFAQGII